MSDEECDDPLPFAPCVALSLTMVQRLCNVNFENEVAFVAVAGTRENSQIVRAVLLLH